RTTVAPRGGRTGVRTGREGGRTDDQGGQGDGRGVEVNIGVDGVPDIFTIIAQQLQNLLPTIVTQLRDVRNVIVNNGRGGCSYKEFLACNPRDFDGKGGAIAYTRWTEKMESVHDMSGCGANQKVKYAAGSLIGKALTWWNTQVQTRGRVSTIRMSWEDFKILIREEFYPDNEVKKLESEFWCHAMVRAGHAAYIDRFPHLVTPEKKRIERYIYGLAPQTRGMVAGMKPTIIQSAILKAGMLTDEAAGTRDLKKNIEKRGNSGELSRDGKVKDYNKRSRTGRAFATTTSNPVKKEYSGTAPKCTTCNYHHQPEIPCRLCTNCNRLRNLAKDCTYHYKAACLRLIRAPEQRSNRPNQALDIDGGQGSRNNGNQARGRAFMLGVEEARQDPNIVTDMFTLNSHYATTLFDSGVDYSFVSTTFIPLLDIKPSNLGFTYEIEITSGQLVEISKVIRAKIVCHEMMVRIPLPHDETLRVLGERPEEKVRHLMSAKAKEQKLKDIAVGQKFPEVFPDDLSGLPPIREIEFRIELTTRATPIVKSSYRLAPSELEELSSQHKEL
ncbi:reverse transcriptase domain-containing protein, partial [Tanacetum coccineum]